MPFSTMALRVVILTVFLPKIGHDIDEIVVLRSILNEIRPSATGVATPGTIDARALYTITESFYARLPKQVCQSPGVFRKFG
jgi:hypothetical protein